MKTLTQQEEQQLEELLAKKEAATALEEEVQKAVAHINNRLEALVDSEKRARKEAAVQMNVFKTLEDADPDMFKLVITKKEIEEEYFPTNHKGEKEFTSAQELAAFEYLEMAQVPNVSKMVDVYTIEVVGLTNEYHKPITVYTRAQTVKGYSYYYKTTGKIELRLSSAQYSDRWVTRPLSLVKKVKELKQAIEAAKEAKTAKQILDAGVLAMILKDFPEAELEVSTKWHSTSNRGQGYYTNIIKAEIGNLELEFSYGRRENKAYYNLSNHGFNLLAAIKAGNDIQGTINVLSSLKADLQNKKNN